MERPKTWKECTKSERIERTLGNAKTCEGLIEGVIGEIKELLDQIEEHQDDAINFREHAKRIERGETEEPHGFHYIHQLTGS